MKQENLKKIGGAVLVAAGVGMGFWVFLILTDILTFIWAIWHFNKVIESYGTVDQFVSKGLAAIFAGLIVWFMHKIVLSVIKLNKKWVPIVVGIMLAWFAVMYVVSWPYHGVPIDIREGTAAKQCYRDQYGVMQMIGLGAKSGPYGEPVRPCTNEDAEEYQRQTGGAGTSFLDGVLGKRPEAMSLHAEVEQVEIYPNVTILHFAVQRINRFRSGRFYRPHGPDYLSDETGQAYDLARDNVNYPDWVDAETHKDFDYSIKQHAETHIIRSDEVYRFTDEYPPLRQGINHLRLHDSRFGELDLDSVLVQGHVIAQARAQAEAEQEVQARAQAEVQREADAQVRAKAEAEANMRAQNEAAEQARKERLEIEARAEAQLLEVQAQMKERVQQARATADALAARERLVAAQALAARRSNPNVNLPRFTPFNGPDYIEVGNDFVMQVVDRLHYPDGPGYLARVFDKDSSNEGAAQLLWVADYAVYPNGVIHRLR